MFKSISTRRKKLKGLVFPNPTLTQQHFKKDCDINRMIQRALSGDINAVVKGHMIDALDAPESMHEALNISARASTAWEELPFSVRHAYGSRERFLAAYDAEVKRLAEAAELPEVAATEPEKSPEKGEPSKGESGAPTT